MLHTALRLAGEEHHFRASREVRHCASFLVTKWEATVEGSVFSSRSRRDEEREVPVPEEWTGNNVK
ncbi:hypothetical protein E2C01_070364 [Portunus trituberculatus]|uniref:Uncharacterized protein n=1 Tax=Portunus trituberculatus TaxID=210409 RepID=A0A5B7I135_PORTR|nr:hypothetical protein [Portunus trituberculatus]